ERRDLDTLGYDRLPEHLHVGWVPLPREGAGAIVERLRLVGSRLGRIDRHVARLSGLHVGDASRTLRRRRTVETPSAYPHPHIGRIGHRDAVEAQSTAVHDGRVADHAVADPELRTRGRRRKPTLRLPRQCGPTRRFTDAP